MRKAAAILLFTVGLVSTGCSLCAPGYLCDYAGVGGKWQRADPENGRVGSILSDPGSLVSSSTNGVADVVANPLYLDSTLVPSDIAPSVNAVESILDSRIPTPAPADEGVIILGESW